VTGSYNDGGLVGWNNGGSVSASYWDNETSSQPTGNIGEGKTTEEMTNPYTYTTVYNNWDFENVWDMSIDTNDGYPHLLALNYETTSPYGGSGTSEDPYQISDVYELQYVKNDLIANYILVNDIDALDTVNWNNGDGFEPIGDNSNKFTGTFDGQEYSIRGLYAYRPSTSYVGLFGSTGTVSEVNNIGLKDINVTGSSYVGGLVGDNGGSVNQSYSTGNVTGNSDVGGFVGRNNDGSITQSYSTANIYLIGDWPGTSGGLVGNNGGSVTQCYSTGMVIGSESDIGGLVGWNFDGSVTQSYWNINTSGIGTSDGGAGRTTEEMTCPYNSDTTYVGWDFINVWNIHGGINEGYPALLSLTNFPPNVSITEPDNNSNASGIFFVNASVTDPNGDSYRSSVYLNNTTGNIDSHNNLPQDDYSVTFDGTSLADGIYKIIWKAHENETEDGLFGFQTINITIDNTKPELFVNDDTTNEGNLNQEFVTCNISFSDANLNSSTIAIYNASGLVDSNISSISPHSVTFENLEEGEYQLNATVSDTVGNIGEMTTREIVLDTTNPIINQIVAPSKANTGDNITIEINATDNIGVEMYNITVDGEEYQMINNSVNYTHNISIPASDSGTLVSSITYNCTFGDAAGNMNSTGDVVIDVSILPIADFSANVTKGTIPLNVEFTDNSSGLVDTWNWDFDDGNTSSTQNPSHIFGAGNFTVNLTVENNNGTSTKYLNIRAADEPAYVLSPSENDLISIYGDEMNFSINSTLYSSYEWFIDGTPLNGSGVTLYNNNIDDSARLSYCNVNTSQYIAQEDFFVDVYNISAHVSNESIDRTDVFSWEWTVTNSSTEEADDIDQIINTTPEVNTSGNESYVRFNTSNQISEKTGIECSIDFVSFNTSNETDGIQIKIEVLDTSALNGSDIAFSKNSVYQYLDISFNNESLVNDGSKNRSIEFKILNNVGGGSLIIDTVYLKHKGTSGWQSYEPELIRNDYAYSYFIVRDITGFSPFAVTADYEYDSGARYDDGIPAYLKLQMLQNRSQSTKEDMDDKTVVTLGSESDEDIVQEDTTSDSSEQTTVDVPISDEGDNGQVLLTGIGVLVLLAILVFVFREKEN
jgi:hypothetical protein